MNKVLIVLLWKHAVVRLRRFIHTPIEFLSPALLFIIIFFFKDYIVNNKELPDYLNDAVRQTETIPLSSIDNPSVIFYTPETQFTKQLMKNVEDYYQSHPPSKMAFFGNSKPVIEPVENLTMLKNDDATIVMFKRVTPLKLAYSIQTNEYFRTYSYSSEDIGPHSAYGIIYEKFMKLQWAIDSSYLKMVNDEDVTLDVYLKEFPYKNIEERQGVSLLCEIFATFCYISLFLTFVFLMGRLVVERVTGIQELMRMVGVPQNMLVLSHVLNTLPGGLVFSIVPAILLTVTSNPLLQYTNGFLIFLMLFLYFLSIVSMAFACSYIVNSTQYTATVATFAFLFLSVPARAASAYTVPRWTLSLLALLPNMPMDCFWDEVAALEAFGLGLRFGNMAKHHTPSTVSALWCYIYLIIQTALFSAISWYLSQVRPGPYGQAQPINFICNFWSKKKVTPDDEEELDSENDDNPEFFEPPLKDAQVGIKIVNVSKVFGNQRALNNVSLDVYKGEITVLLGHNGAGKTTLMSIVTGMISATEGKVYVEGLDTITQKEQMRKYLGLCPQHNLFFPDLTVIEHVIFFSMLKDISYAQAKQSGAALLERLGLGGKARAGSGQLSGGMRRRLQLACALAGGARVLVLDEPTSGLDLETRRELWDLLLSLRESRTVLLSTHFMEEAEALGQRVAALRGGRLRCRAATMRLKRALGTGYRLSFTTTGLPNEPALTTAIRSIIPEATLKETSLNSISYNLPSKHTDQFPKLFNMLESNRSELSINTIGVGISTLEEVFLKLCSDITTTFSEDEVDDVSIEPQHKALSGVPLYCQQLRYLLMRQMKYIWSKKITFLILQIVAPIFMLCFFTVITNSGFYMETVTEAGDSLAIDLNMYETMEEPRVLYKIDSDRYDMNAIMIRNPRVKFERTDDVAEAVLRVGNSDVLEYNKYVVGLELNDTHAKVLYTTVVRHAAPVAMDLLANVLAARTNYSVATSRRTAPHTASRSPQPHENKPKNSDICSVWAYLVIFIIQASIVNSVSLPCRERAVGTRHLHVMAGCAPALHWAAALLAHTLTHVAALAAPAVLIAAAAERDHTIDQPDFLLALFFILVIGIMAFLSFAYITTFYFEERSAGVLLSAVILVFGLICPALGEIPKDIVNKHLYNFLQISFILMPPHTFTNAVARATSVARYNIDPSTSESKSYMSFDETAPGPSILVLFIQFVVYMCLVLLTECGVFSRLCERWCQAWYAGGVGNVGGAGGVVRAEGAYVDKAIGLPVKQIPDAMLVNDVHKKYLRLTGKSCVAVKGVSFSVKKGECFGLLGVNGAGKSTVFKVLTATECATRGSVFANGFFITHFSGEYLRSLGYCPQFQSLDEFLTGYDNLALLLALRGLAPADIHHVASAWLQTIGLERHGRRALQTYSGGCGRRLCAAAALAGGAALLLDEPTAGVDVSARRRLWAAVRRAQRRGRSLVISSHSMDEMEALCRRIAIMSRGKIRALGEAAELRAAHGAGHALVLTLAHDTTAATGADDTTDAADTTDAPRRDYGADLQRFKAKLSEKFNCTLQDEHWTRLHYHINDTLRYSDIFTELENLKKNFPNLLEDYSVTETTLEEVFLGFAREEEVHDGPAPV